MPDQIRDRTTLQSLFADNSSGDISAQDLRDFVASVDLAAEGVAKFRLGETVVTLPGADGTSGQFLKTNADGTLAWASGVGDGLLAVYWRYTGSTINTILGAGLAGASNAPNGINIGYLDADNVDHTSTLQNSLGYVVHVVGTGIDWSDTILTIGEARANDILLTTTTVPPDLNGVEVRVFFEPPPIRSMTSDPSPIMDGMIWFRSDLFEFRIRANSTTYRLTVSPIT